MYIVIAIIAVVVLVIIIVFRKFSGNVDNDLLRFEKMDEVSRDYIEASGKIISLIDDDIKRGTLHLVSMTIEITPSEGEAFSASKQSPVATDNYWEIPSRRLPLFQKNATLPMKIHKEDSSWYFFDFEIEDHLSSVGHHKKKCELNR